MKLYGFEIETLVKEKNADKNIYKIVEIFLNAVNDWSTEIYSLESYEVRIRLLVGSPVNIFTLKKFKKNVDHQRNAWEAESVCQLLGIYEFYNEDFSLSAILQHLHDKLHSV